MLCYQGLGVIVRRPDCYFNEASDYCNGPEAISARPGNDFDGPGCYFSEAWILFP